MREICACAEQRIFRTCLRRGVAAWRRQCCRRIRRHGARHWTEKATTRVCFVPASVEFELALRLAQTQLRRLRRLGPTSLSPTSLSAKPTVLNFPACFNSIELKLQSQYVVPILDDLPRSKADAKCLQRTQEKTHCTKSRLNCLKLFHLYLKHFRYIC